MPASPRPGGSSVQARRPQAGWLTLAWRGVIGVAGVSVLLVLANHLDPQHAEQVKHDEEGERVRAVYEAKLAALEKNEKTAVAPKTERLALNFTQLSFVPPRDPVDAKTGQPRYDDQTPDDIKAYNGREVRIRGYMMPVRMEGNEVREFMIMSNQMACCYGSSPRFWEFIVAVKKGDPVPNLMDTPLTFEGVLKVGDVTENGYWTQFYTLECTQVIK